MRTERVVTNETCNQNCGFCNARRPVEDRAFVARAAVATRIDAAARDGAEVVLTGGEPTLRRDLLALVRRAREAGAGRVVLETNAALIDAALARALAEAGLDLARVHLPAFGPVLDRITRDPGGFERTLAGARALADAGVALEAAAPVTRATVPAIPALPGALAGSGLTFRALVLGLPRDAPDRATLVPLAEAAAVVEATEAAARIADLPLRLAGDAGLPPCAFARPARVAHLFSLTPGGGRRPGYEPVAACGTCVAADRCPGVPVEHLARGPRPDLSPLTHNRLRRRLSTIADVEGQIARELVQPDLYRGADGSLRRARIVRVNFRCNQACAFCFVSTHLPAAPDAAVEAAIGEAASAGEAVLLSGGEPTLNPRLLDYVRLAKGGGAPFIEVQTNAVRLGDANRARALADAGVDSLLISLHGPTAAISDAVTSAPGTFDRTVAGIDAALETPMLVRLNFVFCAPNAATFPDHVDLVARRWPAAILVVSFVAPSTDVVPHTPDLVPRYTEVLPHLAEGLRRAEAAGLRVEGFEAMCGIPLCLVPGALSPYVALAEVPEGFDQGEFRHVAACEGCALRDRCFGIRRGYAELHGVGELRAVTAAEAAGRPSTPDAPVG